MNETIIKQIKDFKIGLELMKIHLDDIEMSIKGSEVGKNE
jgi:hypothetical protein